VGTIKELRELANNGQIIGQYVDFNNQPTMHMPFNPNGSMFAIEGMTSPDGRVLGKMCHSERIGPYLYKNVIGKYEQQIFKCGVEYFSKKV
jgi:phosphoribosylformylglycinamidine synthase